MFSEINSNHHETILWRSYLWNRHSEIATISNHHSSVFGPVFERKFNKWRDLFKVHKKKINAPMKISIELAQLLENKSFNVLPGWKICCNCYEKAEVLCQHNLMMLMKLTVQLCRRSSLRTSGVCAKGFWLSRVDSIILMVWWQEGHPISSINLASSKSVSKPHVFTPSNRDLPPSNIIMIISTMIDGVI